MITLHNWYENLIDYFTFYGGGGKGKKGGSSETTQSIDPLLKPYISFGLGEAQRLYNSNTPQYYSGQTFVDPSQQTLSALEMAESRARAGSPLLTSAQQQQQGVISGEMLNSNPYLDKALAGAAQGATRNYFDAINQAQSGASRAGRFGSNVQADMFSRAGSDLANSLTNKYGDLAFQNFNQERARQEAAVANAPALAATDYQDINQLANVGQIREDYDRTALQADIDRFNFEQNAPYAKLSTYLSSVYGAPQGSVSQTQQSGGGGKIICTAMNHAYGFGSFRQSIWLKQSANLHPAYEKGYHAIFMPVVMYAYQRDNNIVRKAVRNALEHVARHRTADIWKQRKGKRDTLGMIYRFIFEPICYLVGRVK